MEKKYLRVAIALTMMATVAASCSSTDDNQPEPVIDPVTGGEITHSVVTPSSLDLTRGEQELVNSSNDFAFNLFRIAQDEVKSQILSPLSITYALGMLNNGAAGETQQQINQVLGYGETGVDAINDFCYKTLNRALTLDSLTKVNIANTIYVNKDYTLYPDFVAKAKAFYNAEPESRNFYDGKTLDVINQWASDNTEGMIKKVLDEDSFDPTFVSYLLNAIYFKGMWAKKFDKKSTISETFEHAGTTKELTTVDMMTQMDRFAYAENDDYQALRLPYGNGSFEMTVLLPKVTEGRRINDLPKVPTAEAWQKLSQSMDTMLVAVELPRFETDTDIDLRPIMEKLGMTDAFNPYLANFHKFCDVQTYISLMKQVAKIKLDEEGTEAAAVTVLGLAKTSFDPELPKYITFKANHPFLYVINERQTGTIFFIGQYTGY